MGHQPVKLDLLQIMIKMETMPKPEKRGDIFPFKAWDQLILQVLLFVLSSVAEKMEINILLKELAEDYKSHTAI